MGVIICMIRIQREKKIKSHITKVENMLKMWRVRHLTILTGKSCILQLYSIQVLLNSVQGMAASYLFHMFTHLVSSIHFTITY